MTITLRVNSDNDVFIDPTGDLSLASGLLAVTQACEQAAQTLLGEMIFAVDQGVPDFASVWSGTPNTQQFELYLRQAIGRVPDVIEITELSVEVGGGVLSYRATIRTIHGEAAING